ncbi:MAG TPA: nucleotidyltransferase domain-containing protein, partial [Longimicrobiales bacterium]
MKHLSRREAAAVDALLSVVTRLDWPPLAHVALFGSRARGDHDRSSDVDVLLVCRVPPWRRAAAASIHLALAHRVTRETGVPIEPWTVSADDLERGSRTPMLADAVEDSIPLWPQGAPRLHAPFTPADAVFCAGRLLEWVEAGGGEAKRALVEGRWV